MAFNLSTPETELPWLRGENEKLSAMSCPACQAHITNANDKFCRACGMRILMVCSKCQQAVRPADKYCFACGAKRWALFEMWRHGILHRSPGFTAFTVVAAGTAWIALYFWVKSKYHY